MKFVEDLDNEVKQIKDEVFRLSWHMRGGVSSHDLFWNYSVDDRLVMSNIVLSNIEQTNKTGLPLI